MEYVPINRDTANDPSGANTRGKGRLRRDISAWIIMLPALVLFSFFVWVPLIQGITMAFFSTRGTHIQEFVGLANFQEVLAHPTFKPYFWNTWKYVFFSLIIGFFIPIIMASVISEMSVGKGFFRTAVYFPNIVPGMASLIMWGMLLMSGKSGGVNYLLGLVGIEPVNWLTTASIVIPMIVLTMTWKAAGSTSLIYMATISNIGAELYEAATIDGARPLRRWWSITLPSLLSTGRTLLILQIIAVFQILFEPRMMTNGGPNKASGTLMMLVYQYAFDGGKYGQSAAVSVLLCLILAAGTIVYFRVTKNVAAD